jgi:D-alanyl-D-alanine carboxypeptidase
MSNTLYRNASDFPTTNKANDRADLTILGRSLEGASRATSAFFDRPIRLRWRVIGNHNHPLAASTASMESRPATRASGLTADLGPSGRAIADRRRHGRAPAAGRDRIMAIRSRPHRQASAAHTATAVADASPVSPRRAGRGSRRARPTAIADASTARAANAAGEGRWTGDEIATAEPALKAPALRAAQPTAAELGLSYSRQSRQPKCGLAGGGRGGCPAPPPETGQGRRRRLRERRRREDASTRAGWIQIARQSRQGQRAPEPRARTQPFDASLGQPLTEKVRKGDATLYRARFAVLDSASASAACRSLKRTGFSCFTAHD